jgi:hypothetical protein
MVDSRERATRSGRFDSKETQNALKSQKDVGEALPRRREDAKERRFMVKVVSIRPERLRSGGALTLMRKPEKERKRKMVVSKPQATRVRREAA